METLEQFRKGRAYAKLKVHITVEMDYYSDTVKQLYLEDIEFVWNTMKELREAIALAKENFEKRLKEAKNKPKQMRQEDEAMEDDQTTMQLLNICVTEVLQDDPVTVVLLPHKYSIDDINKKRESLQWTDEELKEGKKEYKEDETVQKKFKSECDGNVWKITYFDRKQNIKRVGLRFQELLEQHRKPQGANYRYSIYYNTASKGRKVLNRQGVYQKQQQQTTTNPRGGRGSRGPFQTQRGNRGMRQFFSQRGGPSRGRRGRGQ